MKKFLFISFISLSFIACGEKEKSVDDVIESGNLSEIRAKKSEITTEQNALQEKIEKLNTALEKLDTNKKRLLEVVTSCRACIVHGGALRNLYS